MTRSTPFRFSLVEISFAILAALALSLSPQAALAQHGGGHAGGGGHFAGGGGGHIGGGGGGHFGGGHGGGHPAAGFGTRSYSYAGSHVSSSPIHVFSGPRSAPVAAAPASAAENSAAMTNERAPVSAIQPRSSNISASPFSDLPRGTAMFAEPRGSSETATRMHTTIGFPASTDPRFVSIASAHQGAPLMFSGQGQQVWQNSRDAAAANRNMPRITESRPPQRVFPKPPHIFRRPFLGGGAPLLIGSPGFVFFSPTFGFFGSDFGCDPFWVTPFGCSGFSPFGFGGFGGFGYLGYSDYLGGYGDMGYGYDNGGYYSQPGYDNGTNGNDQGASQEPAPSEWQNPPAENSAGENTLTAPDTVIYLKDGTSFAVKDYWVADGKLHYVTSYGGENAVDLGDLDLQRTTDENAKQGIAITLRPAPESQPPDAQPQLQSPDSQPPPAPEGTRQ
ncbi:MAG TPA: hypothetical protein VGR97_14545 [Candidatus Acidoferrales bacterium]|nr:hypothetical protein [Candidatus Acidoferrales bacterium]